MIIGICGLIGSGKGTVGDMLVEQDFKHESFASSLKDAKALLPKVEYGVKQRINGGERDWVFLTLLPD